jgi:hypothetical protein
VSPGVKKVSQEGKLRKREQLIEALLSATSIERAARKCGISKSTALRWMATPEFRADYASVKRELLKVASAILTRSCAKAAVVLAEVCLQKRPTAHQACRVSAAKAILRIANESFELETFDERLRKLEEVSRDETS